MNREHAFNTYLLRYLKCVTLENGMRGGLGGCCPVLQDAVGEILKLVVEFCGE